MAGRRISQLRGIEELEELAAHVALLLMDRCPAWVRDADRRASDHSGLADKWLAATRSVFECAGRLEDLGDHVRAKARVATPGPVSRWAAELERARTEAQPPKAPDAGTGGEGG